ncbi:MAG TPA: hypothetical protein VFF80_03225 [Bacillota bacterium]|nr:hypothetical protein [Bacillota bacterium]
MNRINKLIIELKNGIESEKYFGSMSQSAFKPKRNSINSPTAASVHTVDSSSPKVTETNSDPNDVSTTASATPQINAKKQVRLELTPEQMVQAIILSEIIGKPVSKRHGIGRNHR